MTTTTSAKGISNVLPVGPEDLGWHLEATDDRNPLAGASSHNLPHYAASHIGQTKIASGVPIGQTFVIQAQQVQ